jgi:hypothetical protein
VNFDADPAPEAGSEDGMVDPIVWFPAAVISARLGSPAGACGPADGAGVGVGAGLAGAALAEGAGVAVDVAEVAVAVDGASSAVAGRAGTTATAVRMAAARTARPVFMVDTSALKLGG